MPTIMLNGGDFGADVEVMVGADDFYLPDAGRPGSTVAVPLAEVAEMESPEGDSLGAVKEAVAKGALGLFLGRPSMMADGFSSATQVKDVEFSVTLADGRGFVAVTDAKTYAELHSAQVAARSQALLGGGGPADDIIAKYLDRKDEAQASAQPASATVAAESEPAEPPPASEPAVRRDVPERRERPEFGRRRPSN